jgi:hypothetical protein
MSRRRSKNRENSVSRRWGEVKSISAEAEWAIRRQRSNARGIFQAEGPLVRKHPDRRQFRDGYLRIGWAELQSSSDRLLRDGSEWGVWGGSEPCEIVAPLTRHVWRSLSRE